MKKMLLILSVLFLLVTAFAPSDLPRAVISNCNPEAKPFRGYSFIHPPIINKRSAYAPYFLDFGQMYRPYFTHDHQRDDNILEWNERFCTKADSAEIDYVVYRASIAEMSILLRASIDPEQKALLPASLAGNVFAQVLAYNGCKEAIEYLIYAKKCEPHVVGKGAWELPERDLDAMNLQIEEGLNRFRNCRSHFFRQRYAYQIVRLAHYSGQWQRAVELYNFLLPKIDRRRSSVIYYWTLGHLAGALKQLGKDADAAYRYALIFKNCPSKRIIAYRSFVIKNDAIWQETMRLCQNDSERATLYVLRAAKSNTLTIKDLETIYQLDARHPALELLLVSNLQVFEKMLLRTPVTDRKYGTTAAAARKAKGEKQLPAMIQLIRSILKERKIENPKLWRLAEGYLLLLDQQSDAASYIFKEISDKLEPKNKENNDAELKVQIEVWQTLQQILAIDANDRLADDAAYRIRSLKIMKEYPAFEPFLQDWLSTQYAESGRLGKAVLAAYGLNAFALNPNLKALDDLLETAYSTQKSGIEYEMTGDSSTEKFIARVQEIKGMYLFNLGQPEAALATLREIPATLAADMQKFSPFKLYINDCLSCPVASPEYLTRRQIIERFGNLEFDAKAAAATGEPNRAAEKYFLLGLGHFNTSWFGYEWEAFDEYRDPQNWYRLSIGTVFPMAGTPAGNRENTDVTRALGYFERAISLAKDPELAAKATFMAAKCQQKQWFCSEQCKYKPGTNRLPNLPPNYKTYYIAMQNDYSNTAFFKEVVRECKWFTAYSK